MGFWTRKRGIRFCCDRLGFYAEILIIFGTVYCNRTRYGVSSLLINDHYCRQESLHKEEDITFIKIRSSIYEIMIAPDKEFTMIVLQDPSNTM